MFLVAEALNSYLPTLHRENTDKWYWFMFFCCLFMWLLFVWAILSQCGLACCEYYVAQVDLKLIAVLLWYKSTFKSHEYIYYEDRLGRLTKLFSQIRNVNEWQFPSHLIFPHFVIISYKFILIPQYTTRPNCFSSLKEKWFILSSEIVRIQKWIINAKSPYSQNIYNTLNITNISFNIMYLIFIFVSLSFIFVV